MFALFRILLDTVSFLCVTTEFWGDSLNKADGWLRKLANGFNLSLRDAGGTLFLGIIGGIISVGLWLGGVQVLTEVAGRVKDVLQNGVDAATNHYEVGFSVRYQTIPYKLQAEFITQTIFHALAGSVLVLSGILASALSCTMMFYLGVARILRSIQRVTFKRFLLIVGVGLFVAARVLEAQHELAEKEVPRQHAVLEPVTRLAVALATGNYGQLRQLR